MKKINKELEESNTILAQIAKSEKYLTPVSLEDQKLFSKFLSKDSSKTYGNTWSYITQGVNESGPNGLGYKYFDGKNLSICAIFPKMKNPDELVLYWIRPIGPNILKLIDQISNKAFAEFNVTSYLKKITPLQFHSTKKLNWTDTYSYPWHPDSPMEDDTFPEIILDREKTLKIAYSNTRAHQISRIKMKIDDFLEEHTLSVKSENFENTAWNITQEFFKDNSKSKNLSIPEDYLNMIFNNPKRPGLNQKIVEVDENPQGFFITEKSGDTTNVHASIGLRHLFKYLPDYCTLHILKTSTDTPYINVGGSESIDRHLFEVKYMPIKMLQMHWATNYTKVRSR